MFGDSSQPDVLLTALSGGRTSSDMHLQVYVSGRATLFGSTALGRTEGPGFSGSDELGRRRLRLFGRASVWPTRQSGLSFPGKVGLTCQNCSNPWWKGVPWNMWYTPTH